jgi:hypothetical protein
VERQRVVSEEIQSVGYDVAHRMLEIKFQTIGVYQYPGVSLSVYHSLMEAPSKTECFKNLIKHRYLCRKVG